MELNQFQVPQPFKEVSKIFGVSTSDSLNEEQISRIRGNLEGQGIDPTKVDSIKFVITGDKSFRIAKLSKKRPAIVVVTESELFVFNTDTFKLKAHL